MLGSTALVPAFRDVADLASQASVRAHVPDGPAASLANAAEEMAMFFSEMRMRDRPLRDRSLQPYESPALSRVEQIEALMDVLWSDPRRSKGDARELAGRLRALAENPAALDRALKTVNGSTEQFLLLSHALARGSQDGGGLNPALEGLRDRVDALWLRDGVRIRADINVSQGLAGAEDGGAADRKTYHDAVLNGETLPRMLALLLTQYGEQIETAVARLRQALGADLGAARPSLPVERLRAILHELFLLGALLPLLANCRDLGRRARLRSRRDRRMGAEAQTAGEEADEGAALLGELAEWVPRWTTSGDVRTLLYRYGMNMDQDGGANGRASEDSTSEDSAGESNRVLVFLHGVRAILRQVPERLFPDEEHKLNADQVMGDVLDTLLLEAPDEPEPSEH